VATQSTTEFTLDTAAELAAEEHGAIEGKSPWLLALAADLRRNYVALCVSSASRLIVDRAACGAGLYARPRRAYRPERRTTWARRSPRRAAGPVVSEGGFVNGEFRPAASRRAAACGTPAASTSFGADNRAATCACGCCTAAELADGVGIGSAIILHVFALLLALLAGTSALRPTGSSRASST
jgi:hypothetical protein